MGLGHLFSVSRQRMCIGSCECCDYIGDRWIAALVGIFHWSAPRTGERDDARPMRSIHVYLFIDRAFASNFGGDLVEGNGEDERLFEI